LFKICRDFYPVPQGKCRDATSIRWRSLPFKTFPVHQSTPRSIIWSSRCHLKISHKKPFVPCLQCYRRLSLPSFHFLFCSVRSPFLSPSFLLLSYYRVAYFLEQEACLSVHHGPRGGSKFKTPLTFPMSKRLEGGRQTFRCTTMYRNKVFAMKLLKPTEVLLFLWENEEPYRRQTVIPYNINYT